MFGSTWLIGAAIALQTPAATTTPAWPDDHPITHLIQNLGEDARRLPSLDTAWLLVAGSGGAIAVHPSDDNLAAWASSSGPASYTAFGRVLGDGWLQGAASLGTYAVGRLSHRPAIAHVGSDLIRAQVLNGIATTGLKAAVGRRRPGGGSSSFPSGHTTATFTSAAVLSGHFDWKVWAPAYGVASYVAWTRVRDHAHWMSDVVFGAALGTAIGRTVTRGHRERTWVVMPMLSRGEAAAIVVWGR